MCNEKLVAAIEKFQKENSPATPEPNEKELQNTVVQLSERVQYLESLLTEVSKIGGALKSTQIGTDGSGDPNVAALAEKLAAIDTTESK